MVGNGYFDLIELEQRVVRVPEKWLRRFRWEQGKRIRVAAGQKQVMAAVYPHKLDHFALSTDIKQDLRLPSTVISWKADRSGIRLGPFVAVYCNRTKDPQWPFASITTLLKDMTEIADELGIPFYVISIGGMLPDKKIVTGWRYDKVSDKWKAMEFPWPDFCIRKIISIPSDLKTVAKRDIRLLRATGCRFLYRNMGAKWNIHRLLSKDRNIVPFLPETRKINSLTDVTTMLESHKLIYVKPLNGTQGRGVYRLERLSSLQSVRLEFQRGSETRRATIDLNKNNSWFVRKFISGRPFLVQQGIRLVADKNGRPADFRWLIQKDGTGKWKVTARIARMGQKDSVTTNVSTGADVLPAEEFLQQTGLSLLRIRFVIEKFDGLAFSIGKRLDRRFSGIGELGIDFGLDSSGHPWLIEVNPNPGRKMLRMTDTGIRALSLKRPLEYARYTVGFGQSNQ
ncbi:YheC/YheD family protein [Effusibacillus lacus]|uniref:YheC/YheD family endospore coat-associated protein n=1 Tax=Effusibacillus lacus TaxID=1348429 RepID=UPI000BB80AC6|nr:YheC/YheD family protein [Effusibacillus lacus]TCS76243.1 glutathione synthase/RimK-type ligase-like ATP-grasp enzyme [Effusibacillus lacus]